MLFRSIAGEVHRGTSGSVGERDDVGLDDGVLEAIDHGVHTEAEHMLVVMCVDVRSDGGTEWIWLIVLGDIDLQNASQANLEFDMAVLVEMVIPNVLCGL